MFAEMAPEGIDRDGDMNVFMNVDSDDDRDVTAVNVPAGNGLLLAGRRVGVTAVQLAGELIAWTQTLAFDTAPARRWEPKRLRLRLFSIAGRIAHHARSTHLRLSAHAPHVDLPTAGLQQLIALPAPN